MISAAIFALCLLAAVPAPQEITQSGKKGYLFRPDTAIVVGQEDLEAARTWMGPLEAELTWKPALVPFTGERVKPAAVYLVTAAGIESKGKRWLKGTAKELEKLPAEAFLLTSAGNGVIIAGKTAAGCLYGLHLLTDLVRQHGLQLPALVVRDWPDVAVRGRHVEGLLPASALAHLAVERVNCLIVESSDFLQFDPGDGERWARFFQEARAFGMEPIPLIPFFHAAGPLLDVLPEAGEGRYVEEMVRLAGSGWSALANPNVIELEESPVSVQISGVPCREKVDFELARQALEGPRQQVLQPWKIRRVPGGKIPDGATVTVQYSWLPPDSQSVCPNSGAFVRGFKRAWEQWTALIEPKAVHVGMDRFARLQEDQRCLRFAARNDAPEPRALQALAEIFRDVDRDLEILAWVDGGASASDLPNVRAIEMLHAAEQPHASRLVRYDGPPERSWPLLQHLHDRAGSGIIVSGGDVQAEDGLSVPAMAWNLNGTRDPWVRGLNAAFGTFLDRPDFEQRLDGLVRFLNERVVRGESPAALRAQGESAFLAYDAETANIDLDEIQQTRALLGQLTAYLELEYACFQQPGDTQLRRFVPLVEAQAKLDPELDAARLTQILSGIRDQGIVPPSHMVFRRALRYYRPGMHAEGGVPLRVPVSPQYGDQGNAATALIDLGGPVGPIFRIDCETGQAEAIEIMGGGSPASLTPWKQADRAGAEARGPLVFDPPQQAGALQLTVRSQTEAPVLRGVEVFAMKQDPAAVCSVLRRIAPSGAPGSQFEWPREPNMLGLVDLATGEFAEGAVWAWIGRDRDRLLLRVRVHEPRPHAMAAATKDFDRPLWNEEALELRIRSVNGDAYRFLVNPLSARADSRRNDTAWNGEWRATAEQHSNGWTALFEVPFKTIGPNPQLETALELNLIHFRHNLQSSVSAWAVTEYRPGASAGWGRVSF
ncbi:MAG: hypothetical protein HYV27_07925 [Candidatus Hydrogenedentes bacterium]|nr:hypothetical protein [Candidatus Hydrogenedentota bacterium]